MTFSKHAKETMLTPSKFSSDLPLSTSHTSHTTRTEACNSSQSESCSTFASFSYEEKRVQFACEQDLCEFFIIENLSDYSELWWTQKQLKKIKSHCHEIAKGFKENQEFCDSVVDILMHGVRCNQSGGDVNNFMEKMTACSKARGLEPHIVGPCKKLADIHYDAVFDAQQEAYDKGLYGTDKFDWAVCQASTQTSRPFEILAIRLAQHDTREAMRAAFSRRNSDSMLKTNKQRSRRRKTISRSSSAVACITS